MDKNERKQNFYKALPTVGLYIHVPFCVSKCPYCDFYSVPSDEETKEQYVQAVLRELNKRKDTFFVDTLYFGGGTPSLLGPQNLYILTDTVRQWFCKDTWECTLEANPAEDLEDVFAAFAQAGGNRVSMGLQVADDTLLQKLGRRHTVAQAEKAVKDLQKQGIHRYSFDLMLGIPDQTERHIQNSVAFCQEMGAEHVSSYLLKLEPNTPFGIKPPALPSEDQTVEFYLQTCCLLEEKGYLQYEISNFAKAGQQSLHNLKYWDAKDVVGIGPAAHSFFNGKRTFYPRDLQSFLLGTLQEEEETNVACPAGSLEEYGMLRLRLTEGITQEGMQKRFGKPIPKGWIENAQKLPPNLCVTDEKGIHLTRDGFLVSNTILARIM